MLEKTPSDGRRHLGLFDVMQPILSKEMSSEYGYSKCGKQGKMKKMASIYGNAPDVLSMNKQ